MDSRSDPRCPVCEEKVSATAIHCVHCGEEFDDPTGTEPGSVPAAETNGDRPRPRTRASIPDALEGSLEVVLKPLVAIGGAIVIGGVLFFLAVAAQLPDWAAFFTLVYGVAGTAILIDRRQTVRRAGRVTCYGTAVSLLAVPFIAFSPIAGDQSLGERVGIFLVAGFVCALVAVALVGVGRWIGHTGASTSSSSSSASPSSSSSLQPSSSSSPAETEP